jgi:hypothetical protein
MYNRPMWPQCWDLRDLGDLKQRDLRNLNLGDLKRGPKSHPTKKIKQREGKVVPVTGREGP